MSNTVGLLAGGLVILIAPRALGAADYGTAEFLLAFFTGVVGLADVGTHNAYYAWLSRRPDDVGLVRGYLIAAALVGGLISGFVLLSFVTTQPADWLWPHIALPTVIMGSTAAWLVWIQQLAQKTVDAHGLTTKGELRILSCRIAGATILLAAAMHHLLSFGAYLSYLGALPFVTTIALAGVIRRVSVEGLPFWKAVYHARPRWLDMLADFKPYILPLIPFSVASSLATLADRWVLQAYGGATQQGLYSLSSRIATLCFIFSSAMAQLLTREFAVAWHTGDIQRIRKVFSRYIPPLYAISAIISVFVAWNAATITLLIGGHAFASGAAAMLVMAFYPMHQTLGQLIGAVFYGTASMRSYASVGIVGVFIGAGLLWLLVAPYSLGGSDLGSLGLAIKMVVTQLITVNLLLFYVAREYDIRFWREIRFQFIPPIACAPAAAISGWIAAVVSQNHIWNLLTAASIYAGAIVLLVLLLPSAFGMTRKDVRLLARKIWR